MFTNKASQKIAHYVQYRQERFWISQDDAKDFIYAAFLLETGTEKQALDFILDLDSDPRDAIQGLMWSVSQDKRA